MKPNKENIVKDILIELEKGISYNECLALNGTKWQLAVRTFARYWNTANEAYKEALNKRQTELDALTTDLEKERLKSAILSKNEALALLSKTAQGKARQVGKDVIIPSHSESTNAIKAISELLGWNMPTKSEVSNTIKTITELTPEQAKEYLKEIDNAV